VLACAQGKSNTQVQPEVGASAPTIAKWRKRFLAHHLDGLVDEPRRGRPRAITDQDIQRVVTAALESTPANDTH
jgi:transposase